MGLYLKWLLSFLAGVLGDFDVGEDPGNELQQPLWMAFNSVGLHFASAVSVGVSNYVDVKHLKIPVNQVSGIRMNLVGLPIDHAPLSKSLISLSFSTSEEKEYY